MNVVSPRDRSNLLPDRTRFVGREPERAAIRSLFAGTRLVSIVGPSGIGKTRLARQIAREELAALEEHGGAWFCDLSAARGPEELLATWAGTLGVPLGRSGPNDGASRLFDAIAARGPILLVLDNLEHAVAAAGPLIEACLDRAPEARILATSIVRLGVESEACFELQPLGLSEAVELYLERMLRADPHHAPDAPAIEELVQRLDRIPLAIELAAARSRVLRPRQLLERLGDRFSLLQGGKAGRHASLESAIRWSWELLSPWEASALAQLSVFAGGLELDAAEAVIDLAPFSAAPPVLDVIEALRDKSLVQLDAGEPPRFRLYESVRDFAWRELERLGDPASTSRRHAAFYAGMAPAIDGDVGPAELRRLAREADNLLAAHRNCLEAEPALAARAVLAINPLVALRGPPTSEAGLLDAAVEAARRASDRLLTARTLRARAVVRNRHGRGEEALADLRDALSLAHGAPMLEGHVWIELGRVHAYASDLGGARAALDEALRLLAREDAPFLQGYARNMLGVVEEPSGRLAEAAAHFEAALRLFRLSGNRRFEAVAQINLGVVRLGEGRHEEALRLTETAWTSVRALGDFSLAADALVNLGTIHLCAGRLAEAEPCLRTALVAERDLGNRLFEAQALGHLGMAAHERGRLEAAQELYLEAIAICRDGGEKRYHGIFLAFLGAARAELGQEAEAARDFHEARRELESLGDPANLATLERLESILEGGGPGREPSYAPGIRTSELVIARRLVQRACGGPRSQPVLAVLRVGPDATWFEPPGGSRCDLRRRVPIRRILQALVDRRLRSPGTGLPLEALFSAGWPGESALPNARAARVYVAVRTLRAAGLESILLRRDDGYLLDPELPIENAGF